MKCVNDRGGDGHIGYGVRMVGRWCFKLRILDSGLGDQGARCLDVWSPTGISRDARKC